MAINILKFHKTDLYCPKCGRRGLHAPYFDAPSGKWPIWIAEESIFDGATGILQSIFESDIVLVDQDSDSLLHICIDCLHMFFYDDYCECLADQAQKIADHIRAQCQSLS